MKENVLTIAFCIGFFLCLYIIRDKDAPLERFPLSEKNKAVSPHMVKNKVMAVELSDSPNNPESE
mgnify:CR=1 FL=1